MPGSAVSVGQAVKALVLNGLGFVNRALYLVPVFHPDKPTERLIGAEIRPDGSTTMCWVGCWTAHTPTTSPPCLV
ncbi:MAG: DUF4277 domain-containing protein [Candidatus Competibacteraceae bacterium]